MKKVKYTGTADLRIITSDEWSAIGLSSKTTEWRHGETLEVANAAADWLLANQPYEFAVQGEQPDPEVVAAAEADVNRATVGEGGGLSGGGSGSGVAAGGTTTGGGGPTGAGTTGTGTVSGSTATS